MRRKTNATLSAIGAGAVAVALGITGCGANPGPTASPAASTVPQSDIDKAMQTPTTLTFWAWTPKLQDEVDLFQKKYPAIKVNLQNVGQGAAHYAKVRTALKAGDGAPDVVQMEYQETPSFTMTDSLLDLAPYGAEQLKSNYVPWVWNQVDEGGKVYGLPQDSGPMGNLYRTDIFAKAGITHAPATWDEYAKDAAVIKSSTGAFISNLAPNDPGQLMGLFWQAGVKPFGYDGNKSVTVNVASPEAKKVASYWQKLIQAGQVSVDADFNDQWYQGLANGKYAGWLTAAWGPVFLQGTAAGTAGKWNAAELPQQNGGEHKSGNWGGSADAVLKTSKNPIAAYELVKFLNDDKASTMQLATKQFLFPPQNDVLKDPSYISQKSDFYGGQQVNQTFAGISDSVDTSFQWLPYMDYAYSSFNDTVGKAIAEKSDITAGLDAWQSALKDYGTQQGFTVQ